MTKVVLMVIGVAVMVSACRVNALTRADCKSHLEPINASKKADAMDEPRNSVEADGSAD